MLKLHLLYLNLCFFQGTSAIEGIRLDLSQIKDDLSLSAHTFQKMTKLSFLKIYFPHYKKRSCKLSIPFGLGSLSNTLRYLRWDNYPLESLPSTFCPGKIVELCMQGSHLKKLWDGVQVYKNICYSCQFNSNFKGFVSHEMIFF